jgi:hypothetical protein
LLEQASVKSGPGGALSAKHVLEQAEAERLRDQFIGTEHLVLAMLGRPGVASRALAPSG